MSDLLDNLKKLVSYDAERDFYAKHFPCVREDESILVFRPMKKRDITAVCKIENQVYDFPWNEGTFHDCFKAGYSSWVLEKLGEIFAYGILSISAGEAHLMNLCISPVLQNQGYGQKLMGKLMEIAQQHSAKSLLLEVRPSNTTARELYEKMGFDEVGIRKDYYPAENGREDALMLQLALDPETLDEGEDAATITCREQQDTTMHET